MSRLHRWVVLNADGSIACQPLIEGPAAPSATGDNPDGLREFRVSRHADPTHEHFDPGTGRWVSDKAMKQRRERRERLTAMRRDELADAIQEEIRAEMRAEIADLAKRIAALEAAGAK